MLLFECTLKLMKQKYDNFVVTVMSLSLKRMKMVMNTENHAMKCSWSALIRMVGSLEKIEELEMATDE